MMNEEQKEIDRRNAEYLAMIDESMEQIKQGKVVIKTTAELEEMAQGIEYKGYYGTVEYSPTDKVFFGKVAGINSLISYEGDSIQSLKKDFEGAIDDYLEMCAQKGTEPKTPSDMLEYKGYGGTVEYSAADKTLFGKVVGVKGYLSYVGDSLESLRKNFEDMIDDYLETCAKDGVEPQTTMSDKKENPYPIGSIRIDGITPADEFLEFAEKEKRGEITDEDIQRVFLKKHTVKEE